MIPDAFEGAEFFPRRPQATNAYSGPLLWAEHISPDEKVRAVVMHRQATLILTNRRLMELTPHVDDFGFWNVKQFEGYEVTMDLPLAGTSIKGLQRGPGGGYLVALAGGGEERTFSLEPWRDLTEEHLERFVGVLKGYLTDGGRGGPDREVH